MKRTGAPYSQATVADMSVQSVVIRRVRLRNYKSIAACDVRLGPLTFLVGPNGSGKSNFLDATRFVADSLRTSLDHALRERGTIKEVRRRSGGHPNHFALRLDFTLATGSSGHYSFRVGAKQNGGYEVQEEECCVESSEFGARKAFYKVESGSVMNTSEATLPASLADRLMLVAASGQSVFRPVYDALAAIEVYNLNPQEISAL
jgi:energy-coupling factor transporter ATP-binding protein EcfA2